MKNTYLLILLSAFLFIISCKDDAPKKETASGICADSTSKDCQLYIIGSNLVKVANGKPSSVDLDGDLRNEWNDFELTLTYDSLTFSGTYLVTGIPDAEGASEVWGSPEGTWEFSNDSGTQIDLGGIIRDVAATPSFATITFDVPEPADGKTNFGWEWTFSWAK